ncbi:DUF1657 domain-containing protein [Oceanobacillus sp. M65]|jgi:hypothetical protein|uniref:DUF1657 domain-containing protein n=1 Tax=Oceanobacillus jordanicus TaxID=2867266 RepID=A0AAW5B8I0_9BACI|nr:DUF1657 domain-containing protein [Oceanobacillus jordanicus]AVQ98867.1 hypothetical protein OBCHQ24_07575 [Oceanobacillus iheyensis]MCG3420358.1 DUF1657 domain-containing protein [Oceanobacillus jordanicus]
MTVGSQVKTCFSSIKSVEASLQMLAEKTYEQNSYQAFKDAEAIITEVKNDLQKQVIMLSKEEPQYN